MSYVHHRLPCKHSYLVSWNYNDMKICFNGGDMPLPDLTIPADNGRDSDDSDDSDDELSPRLKAMLSPSLNAYSNNPLDRAHEILERYLMRYGTKASLVLYVDGGQALEKQHAAKTRKAAREKSTISCEQSLDELERRIDNNLSIRKRHFTDVRTSLGRTFYWSLPARQAFITYMLQAGWTVRPCETEADLAIALDCQPGDVVISADSDMLAYASISTLWRPISKGLHLVYELIDVRRDLGLSPAQLTALAVVSSNDYNKNVYFLGPAINYSIIKSVQENDPRSVVSAYLANHQVLSKNTHNQTFELALRVFVDLEQTPVESDGLSAICLTHNELRKRFTDLCAQHEQFKKHRQRADQKNAPKDEIVRLRSSRTSNRFKTVESPDPTSSSLTGTHSPLQQNISAPQHVFQHPPSEQQPSISTGSSFTRIHPPSQQLALNSQNDAQVSSSFQEPVGHPPLQRTRTPRHRPRFSFKERRRKIVHDPPPKAKQYVLKYYKKPLETPTDPASTEEPKSKAVGTSVSSSKPPAKMDKKGLVYSLGWHHPVSTLEVGTLRKNVERALPNLMNTTNVAPPTDLEVLHQGVVDCISEATRLAARVKREGQQLIGRFVETLRDRMIAAEEHKRTELAEGTEPRAMTEQERLKARKEAITEPERTILSYLCKPVKPQDTDDDQDDVDEDTVDLDGQESDQMRFLLSFLTYLYSGNRPAEKSKGIGTSVNVLIESLRVLGFHEPSRRPGDRVIMPFTPTSLVRSAAGQLTVELNLMYGHGTHALFEKARVWKESGRMGEAIDTRIQGDISAVENFLFLNDLTNNGRKIIPFTTSQQPFFSFSERDLALFFWKRDLLKVKLIQLANSDGSTISSTNDLETWLGSIHPGFIIKHFICDVAPQGLTSRQRGKVGHRAAVRLLTLPQIRTYLETVKNDWLDPVTYAEKGYILRGSIRTDGFRVQLLAFKIRELQSVRYRRLDEHRIPARLTSTVGGVNYFLQEIRHVISSNEDVQRLWPGVRPEEIRTLTLDGGQACVIGAFAHLPDKQLQHGKGKEVDKGYAAATLMSTLIPTPGLASTQEPVTPPPVSSRTRFYNLAVKQKAVYQPSFKFRRWLESEKKAAQEGVQETIEEIETRLPPLKGPGASIVDYVAELKEVEHRLLEFYGGRDQQYKRHKWDMERALHYEYQLIADRLLGIVGGSVGRPRDPSNAVLIGVGLSKFNTRSGLSSLDSSFLSFFVQKARSLGYIVVGLNEYYTSKKCPHCGLFVAQVTLRRLFCPHCHVYHHRDIMGAENMANIVQGYLIDQERPEYLQPVASDGSLPWKKAQALVGFAPSPIEATTSGGSTATSSRTPGRQKRAASTSSSGRGKTARP
ncbi:hypothetical protein BGZ47_000819 [Haplosporangium gracile]|nr:hypothetical protein BGZ47_000819 [Haplosporangium gracile]